MRTVPRKKTWPMLAVLAGAALIFFEWRAEGGITADNWFWLLVGTLVVILGGLAALEKPRDPDER